MAERTPAGGALLIDANLLLVLVVGTVDREEVARFKRTRAYSAEDFDRLLAVAARYSQVVVTPHVLTEVSNLAGQLQEHLRVRAFSTLAQLVPTFDEQFSASSALVRERLFGRLGLTDAAVAAVARDYRAGLTVLTADLDLYLALSAGGATAINFNHVRAGAWKL